MKSTRIVAFALGLAVSACSATGPTKTVGGKPLIARSALLDECPNSPELGSAGTTESAFLAALGAKAAVAIGDKVIDQIAKSISDAAANDAKAFTVSGSSPEYLYRFSDSEKFTKGCLIVAVGPHVQEADPCGVGIAQVGAPKANSPAFDQQAAERAAAAANAGRGPAAPMPSADRVLVPIGDVPAAPAAPTPPNHPVLAAAPANPEPAAAVQAAPIGGAPAKNTAWLGTRQVCDAKSDVARKMRSWGMDAPIFYAEVRLVTPENGPVGYVQPTIIRAYYPAPVSDLKPSKVKDVALSIQGVAPTAGLDGGKPVLSLGFASSWLRPGTDYTASEADLVLDRYGLTAPTFGHWLAVPMDVKGNGSSDGFGGPINMQTTFTEVPDPSKWLQELAKFVDKNKERAKSEAKEAIELALSDEKQEQKELDDRTAKRALETKALESCAPLKAAIAEVVAADAAVNSAPDAGKKADALVVRGAACVKAQGQFESASGAWKDAKKAESLCFLPDGGWPSSGCDKPQ